MRKLGGWLAMAAAAVAATNQTLMTASFCPQILSPVTIEHEAQNPNMKARSGGRYVSSNHKTGTDFDECLISVTEGKSSTPVKRGSFHVTGGFRSDAFQMNMVRNPFVMVDSGYLFHRRNVEWWCAQPIQSHVRGLFSVPRAAEVFNDYFFGANRPNCMVKLPNAYKIDMSESYSHLLSRVPVAVGLMVESLRVLTYDGVAMVHSVESCLQASLKPAPDGKPPCASVLLDDVMMAGEDAFHDVVVPQLRIQSNDPVALRNAYMTKCSSFSKRAVSHSTIPHVDPSQRIDPRSKNKQGQNTHEVDVVTNTTRDQRIVMLRHLDAAFLGGALARYEKVVLSSVLHPPSSINATSAQSRHWVVSDLA